jgi:undecaprenyl-diphosphatase
LADFFNAVLLGFAQGIAEFLPISSSGHLVLLSKWFAIKNASLHVDLILHLATLLSIIVYYHKDIVQLIKSVIMFRDESLAEQRQLSFYIIVASIPTAVIGLLLKDVVEHELRAIGWVALFLIVTGLFNIGISRLSKKSYTSHFSLIKVVFIGIIQGLAVLPGISRSGSTTFLAMFMRIDAKRAMDFSFILSIPAVLGAVILDFDVLLAITSGGVSMGFLVTSFMLAFLSGLLAIRIFKYLLKKDKFLYLGVYCISLGIVSLIL